MLKKIFSLLILVSVLSFVSCGYEYEENSKEDNAKIHIVTTIFPLYEFAREVGGDSVDVLLLLPPGVEAHSYEPKPSDIISVSRADIFVMIGASMEPWADDLLAGVSNEHLETFVASDYVDLLGAGEDHDDEHEEVHENGQYDPHLWLDFSNDVKIVEGLRDSLSKMDVDHASDYSNNADEYIKKLKKLDAAYFDELSSCAKDTFITGGHGAYAYLANRYGVKYVSAYDLSPDGEPTPQQLKSLIDVSRETGVGYILFEELVSPRLAEAIAEETGAEVVVVNPVSNLSKDDYEDGMSFEKMMWENLETLTKVLECQK